MDTEDKKTIIEDWASREPFLDHEDYKKCGSCLREVLRKEVAQEFMREGKINNNYLAPLEKEVTRRFQESFLFKEITRLKKEEGFTLDEAIAKMEKMGYYP